jgi:hypothetical protein
MPLSFESPQPAWELAANLDTPPPFPGLQLQGGGRGVYVQQVRRQGVVQGHRRPRRQGVQGSEGEGRTVRMVPIRLRRWRGVRHGKDAVPQVTG